MASEQASALLHLYKTHTLPEPPWDFTEPYNPNSSQSSKRSDIEHDWRDATINWLTRVAVDVMVGDTLVIHSVYADSPLTMNLSL